MRTRTQKETAIKLLREARNMIADFDNWCWDIGAVDDDGEEVSPCDDVACKWCATGAIDAVAYKYEDEHATLNGFTLVYDLNDAAKAIAGADSIILVNDWGEKEEGHDPATPPAERHTLVLKCYDHAIERLEKQL